MTHGKDVEPLLLAEIAKSAGGVVSLRDIGKKADTENPILSSAWNTYPWPTGEVRGDGESSGTPSSNS